MSNALPGYRGVIRALRKRAEALPLCPACVGKIGGACGGPDADWRPAARGEWCKAADHDHNEYVSRFPCCEMKDGCAEVVTHIDDHGFVYCRDHGIARHQSGMRCRALRPHEARRVLSWRRVASY